MNYAELFKGRIVDKGRLIAWHDDIVLAVFRADPPILLGMVAWFMDLRIRVYAVIPLSESDFRHILKITKHEPCSLSDWTELHSRVESIVTCREEMIDVFMKDDTDKILKEIVVERKDIVDSLPFDVEGAIEPSRVSLWRQHFGINVS